ncbi:substrate-binding domain-containing protein [Fervidicoccus fontis]|uniref:substrate-binding domain-containing protein n=1 Tax=Fervidicoccus fontis TaxID=683846 RepID=UPI003907F896
MNEFMKQYPNIKISYEGVGSGAGQSNFFAGVFDFAGSDPPLSKSQWSNYTGRVMQIPIVAGAIVIVYNVPNLNGSSR